MTNLRHHLGLAAWGKTLMQCAASRIPVMRRFMGQKMNTKHRCDMVDKFCWRVAAASGKSADPILHCEPPLLKHCSDAMGQFKN
jgi:phage tail protein X